MSGGFWCISNRVAVNRASEESIRSRDVGLSATHFKMHVLPPLVGLAVSVVGARERLLRACPGAP